MHKEIRKLEGWVDKFNSDFKFEDYIIYKNKKSLEVWLNPSLNNVKNIIKNAQDEVVKMENGLKDSVKEKEKEGVKDSSIKQEVKDSQLNGTLTHDTNTLSKDNANKNTIPIPITDKKVSEKNNEDSNSSSANSSPIKPKTIKSKPVPKTNFT
jgi:Zn-dependent M16 (insulinase) family peptidase